MKSIDLQYDLVEKCKSGDRKSQYRLYQQYSQAMYNICLRMLKQKMDAEDVLQSSFVDVFSKMDSFKYQSTIGAWIKRIVINNCINHLNKRRMFFDELDDKMQVIDNGDEVQNHDYQLQLVNDAIMELPDGYRVVLTMYLMEGYDHKEIGEVLGISESTSKSQYSRAKTKLKELIYSASAQY